MQELIAILDKLKGYILAVTGLLYIAGLFYWSFYALQNHLGHIDALQLQYLVAGFIPGFIMIYFFWLFKYSSNQSAKITSWLQKNSIVFRTIKLIISLCIWFFVINTLFNIHIFQRLPGSFSGISPTVKNILIFILLNGIIILSPAFLKIEDDEPGKKRSFLPAVLYYFLASGNFFIVMYLGVFKYFAKPFVVIIAVLMLYVYYYDVYPLIPQEMGGVKPKYAILVTDPGAFTKQDCAAIFPDSMLLKTGQTDTLSVFFYNDNKFIFKTHKEVVSNGANAKTFEIARSFIKSVKWLN